MQQVRQPEAPLDWYLQVGALTLAILAMVAAPDWILYGLKSVYNALPLTNDFQLDAPKFAWESGKTDQKTKAMLEAIAHAEGTTDSYNIQFTGTKFTEYADHPRQIKCSNELCSDAAGRYQFLSTTWDGLKDKLNLPDFSPESQEKAAIELLKESGAAAKLQDGDVDGAMCAAGKVWASLPCNDYGQPQKTTADLKRVFEENLSKEQAKP